MNKKEFKEMQDKLNNIYIKYIIGNEDLNNNEKLMNILKSINMFLNISLLNFIDNKKSREEALNILVDNVKIDCVEIEDMRRNNIN